MKKYILQKLDAVLASKEKAIANINALSGAEQAYREMIANIEKMEKERADDRTSENEQKQTGSV